MQTGPVTLLKLSLTRVSTVLKGNRLNCLKGAGLRRVTDFCAVACRWTCMWDCVYIYFLLSKLWFEQRKRGSIGLITPSDTAFYFFFFLLSKVTFYWTLHFITETLLYKMLNAVNNDCKQTNQEKPHSLFFNITFI